MKRIFIFIGLLFLTRGINAMDVKKQLKKDKSSFKFQAWFDEQWGNKNINELKELFPIDRMQHYHKVLSFICAAMHENLHHSLEQLLKAGIEPDITISDIDEALPKIVFAQQLIGSAFATDYDTCLCAAVKANILKNVKLLLRHNANPDGNIICSPLHEAVKRGNLEIIELLLNNEGKEIKADPNKVDPINGLTPLMVACYNPSEIYNKNEYILGNNCYEQNLKLRSEVILALLNSGADIQLTDSFGDTAIHIARNSNLNEIVLLLQTWQQKQLEE